ncbi:DUF6515 family protein [Costertonia aggregata]|uniref:Uncharacterized protein n=1 Tax=Costertonia aggregata TaxID=343403 RepID=A0A7H9ALU6_9FLAO|nr:DUF6515 family protein [Costertonia aggregata]QLG44387.1 hypothetical protein HYG79_03175 [Costertonia aggregata]
MKNNIIKYSVLGYMCLLFFTEKVEAQRKSSVRVKNSRVVVKKRAKVRPVRVKRVAHYGYRGLPSWGKTVRTVSAGFIGVRFGGIGYRFHNGVWYRPKGRKFIVARAPFSVRVRVLPVGYRSVAVGSNTYFYYYGTYYEKVSNKDEYEVIQPPIGAQVDALPEGYEVVEINDKEYFKFENTYYEPIIDNAKMEYYMVVAPTELN